MAFVGYALFAYAANAAYQANEERRRQEKIRSSMNINKGQLSAAGDPKPIEHVAGNGGTPVQLARKEIAARDARGGKVAWQMFNELPPGTFVDTTGAVREQRKYQRKERDIQAFRHSLNRTGKAVY